MKIDLGSFWQALRCRARLLIIILDDLRSHLPPSTSDPRQTHLNFILYIPFSSEPTCQVEILRTKSWIWLDFINHLSKTLIRMRKTMFSYAFPVLCWGLDAQTKKSNSVLSIRICPSALIYLVTPSEGGDWILSIWSRFLIDLMKGVTPSLSVFKFINNQPICE